MATPTPVRGSLPRALAYGAFVLLAVLLEALAGTAANSPEPGWARYVVPLAWPQPLRVVWWLLVAAAAAGYHVQLRRTGMARSRVMPFVLATPFVLFAAGVAVGAEWSAWH